MTKLFRLSRCPYCHKKISYLGSMFLKTKGEYNCRSCKCISNVVISRAAYAIASAICVIALLIVVIYSLAGDHGSLLGIFLVLLPFLLFYITIPFLVRLAPCKDKSAVEKLMEGSPVTDPDQDALQSVQKQTKSKPVSLDVDEDFTQKYMRAKNNIQSGNAEDNNDIPSEPEDIQNTKIAFDIKEDEDFSRKFMEAKMNARSGIEKTQEEAVTEPEDIQNTKIAIDLKEIEISVSDDND